MLCVLTGECYAQVRRIGGGGRLVGLARRVGGGARFVHPPSEDPDRGGRKSCARNSPENASRKAEFIARHGKDSPDRRRLVWRERCAKYLHIGVRATLMAFAYAHRLVKPVSGPPMEGPCVEGPCAEAKRKAHGGISIRRESLQRMGRYHPRPRPVLLTMSAYARRWSHVRRALPLSRAVTGRR